MALFIDRYLQKESIKIIIPPVLTILLIILATYGIMLPRIEERFVKHKKEMIRELTQTTWGLIASYEMRARKGEITVAEAKEEAINEIKELRYGAEAKDYFWINDLRPYMIMHPYRPDLDGQDLSAFSDTEGKYLFNEVVKIAQQEGAGYVSYQWQWKDNPVLLGRKLSYIKLFEPWGWIVGTGVYLEDIRQELSLLTKGLAYVAGAVILVVTGLSIYIIRHGMRVDERRRAAEQELRKQQSQLEDTVHKRTRELLEANAKLAREIDERKQVESDLRESDKKINRQNDFLNDVIESIPYPFYVVDAENHSIILANSQATKGEDLADAKCYTLTHGRQAPCQEEEDHTCPLEIVKLTKKPVKVEHVHYDDAGKQIFVEVHGYPIFDDNGNVIQMIEAALDVSDRKMLEEKLKSISITDELTGLLNRRGFMVMAEKLLTIATRNSKELFLLYTDLDNLKWINDLYGHQVGDAALADTAKLLEGTFRQSDIIARIGGDEFTVLLTGETEFDSETAIARRFDQQIQSFNDKTRAKYELSLSKGIVRYIPAAQSSLDDLLAQADKLMYEEKMKKKNAKH